MLVENDQGICLEDKGDGFKPDDDCTSCMEDSSKLRCAEGYVKTALSFDGINCTSITCTKLGNIFKF